MTSRLEDIKAEFFVLVNKMRQGNPLPCNGPEGLTPTESHVVHMIYLLGCGNENDVRPKDLAPSMHVTPSALSQMLKNLEAKRLIRRHRVDEDSRAVVLTLTEEGQELALSIDARWRACVSECIEYVGYDDFLHMMVTMGKVFDFQAHYAAKGIGVNAGGERGGIVAATESHEQAESELSCV